MKRNQKGKLMTDTGWTQPQPNPEPPLDQLEIDAARAARSTIRQAYLAGVPDKHHPDL